MTAAAATTELVPVHPEPVDDDARALRWVVPVGTLGFVGPVDRATGALADLVGDGTVEGLDVEPDAVRVRLGEGRGWREHGAAVRSALQAALADPAGWVPRTAADPDAVLRMAVDRVVEGEVGAYVRSHGGVVTVLEAHDGEVTVSLSGSCDGCPAAGLTLTGRFETALRELYPGLRAVRSVDPEPAVGSRRHLGIIPLGRR